MNLNKIDHNDGTHATSLNKDAAPSENKEKVTMDAKVFEEFYKASKTYMEVNNYTKRLMIKLKEGILTKIGATNYNNKILEKVISNPELKSPTLPAPISITNFQKKPFPSYSMQFLHVFEESFLKRLHTYSPFTSITLEDLKSLSLSSVIELSLLTLFCILHQKNRSIKKEESIHFFKAIKDYTEDKEKLLTESFKKLLHGQSFPELEKAFKLVINLQKWKEFQQVSIAECCNKTQAPLEGEEFETRKPLIGFIKTLMEQVLEIVHSHQIKNAFPQCFETPTIKVKSGQKIPVCHSLERFLNKMIQQSNNVKNLITSQSQKIYFFTKNLKLDNSFGLHQLTDLSGLFFNLEKFNNFKMKPHLEKLTSFDKQVLKNKIKDTYLFPDSKSFMLNLEKQINVDIPFDDLMELKAALQPDFESTFSIDLKSYKGNPKLTDDDKNRMLSALMDFFDLTCLYLDKVRGAAKDSVEVARHRAQILKEAPKSLLPFLEIFLKHVEKMRCNHTEKFFQVLTSQGHSSDFHLPNPYTYKIALDNTSNLFITYFQELFDNLSGDLTEQIDTTNMELSLEIQQECCFMIQEILEKEALLLKILNNDEKIETGIKNGVEVTLANYKKEERGRIECFNAKLDETIKAALFFNDLAIIPYQILTFLFSECIKGIKNPDIEPVDEKWLLSVDSPTSESDKLTSYESKENEIEIEEEPIESKLTAPILNKKNKSDVIEFKKSLFDSPASIQTSALRILLAKNYDVINEAFAPTQGFGKLQPYQSAQHQTLHSLDILQGHLEAAKNAPAQTKKSLYRKFKLRLHLAYEQCITAEYLKKYPEGLLTHSLSLMTNELGTINKYSNWIQKNQYGTLVFRYPFAFKKLNINEEMDLDKAAKEVEEFSHLLTQTAGIPSLKEIKERLKGIDSVSNQTDQVAEEVSRLLKDNIKAIEEIQRKFDLILQNNSDVQSIKNLKNAKYHLEDMQCTAQLMEKYPEQRFLHPHMLEAIFSTQYFLENVGAALSLRQGHEEVHTHDLNHYCEQFGLANGLSDGEKQILQEINVKKGSEYLYKNQKVIKGVQLLSESYLISRVAALAGEGFQTSTQSDTQVKNALAKDSQFFGQMILLIAKVVNQLAAAS